MKFHVFVKPNAQRRRSECTKVHDQARMPIATKQMGHDDTPSFSCRTVAYIPSLLSPCHRSYPGSLGAAPWASRKGAHADGLRSSRKQMLRKKCYVVRKKNHVVRKLFYVASIFLNPRSPRHHDAAPMTSERPTYALR